MPSKAWVFHEYAIERLQSDEDRQRVECLVVPQAGPFVLDVHVRLPWAPGVLQSENKNISS